MLIRIDPSSGEAIFEQIRQEVRRAVARAQLEPGAKLPSVRELARELSVNPNTVVRAYEALATDGVIVRRQGAGCFVSEARTRLDEGERLRQLDALCARLATEGWHLGFDTTAIEGALRRALAARPSPREEGAQE